MAMNSEEDSIPQDITIKIFSWLLVKSLLHFRCISKFYNSIVLEPNFVDLHLSNYSKINRGDTKLIACVNDVCFAIEDHHDEDGNAATKYHQSDNFSKLDDQIINCRLDYNYHFESDNGLFCVWDLKYIAICNPATREVRFLPDVPHEGEYFICSIGFEPEENKYKVVVTIETYEKLSRAWVFTLGIDKSWREMIEYDEHGFFARNIFGICISGIIYRVSLGLDDCIVAFDVNSKIFTSITMPIELLYNFSDSHHMLIEVNGKLGIMNYCDSNWFGNDIYPWVFEEDEEWKLEKLHFPLESRPNQYFALHPFRIRKYGAEEIVFAMNITFSSLDGVFLFFSFYDMKNKSWRQSEVQEFRGRIESICTYSESLFSLENIGSVHQQL